MSVRWREDLHPRRPDGRFGAGSVAGGTADARQTARAARAGEVTANATVRTAGPTGPPATLPAAAFDAAVPANRRLYRGTKSEAGARATIAGSLGSGDFGAAIYLGRSIPVAQGYAQQHGNDKGGRILRGAITGDAKIAEPPQKVQRRGGTKVAEWAAENNVDVIDLGAYQIVRNPAVLTFDERTYTLDESVVLDHVADGYPLSGLPASYDDAIRSLGHHR